MSVAYFWTGAIVINLPLPSIYPSGNIYPGFSLSLSLRCLKQSCLTHTETQTQTHTCYSHISKFPQDFMPKRGTVCLCRSVLQTGCLQQQHPWCSGIVTSPLFQLTCVSHLIGFYHLSPVFGPIFSILFYIKTQSKAFLVPLNLWLHLKGSLTCHLHSKSSSCLAPLPTLMRGPTGRRWAGM